MFSNQNSGYTTREQQDAYDLLPRDEQFVLYTHHWDTAHKMERSMKGPKTIEIAGKKIPILLPHTAVMSNVQKEQMRKEGWLINPSPKEIKTEEERITQLNKGKDPSNANNDIVFARYYHDDSFKKRTETIDGQKYAGYTLFQRVMKYVFGFHFPEYKDITEEQATEKGIYPNFAWRSHGGRIDWAKNHNGHLAKLDHNYKGELRDIWNTARQAVINMGTYGNNPKNEIVLGYLGIAPLGGRDADDAEVYSLGDWAGLGSGSLYGDGNVRALVAHRVKAGAGGYWYGQRVAVSSVVVLDK